MRKFPNKLSLATFVDFQLLVVRVASWLLPLRELLEGNSESNGFPPVVTGIMVGFSRLRGSRSARSLVAANDGLTIYSGLQKIEIAWDDVLGVETWRRMNRVDHVAIHYRLAGERAIATCWDQNGREDLAAFVKACGAAVSAFGPRTTIELAGLGDRGVWLPLLRRFAVDVAVPLGLAAVAGLARRELPVALIVSSVSMFMACGQYRWRTARFASKDGLWWRVTDEGLKRIQTIPPSLRLWVDALASAAYRAQG